MLSRAWALRRLCSYNTTPCSRVHLAPGIRSYSSFPRQSDGNYWDAKIRRMERQQADDKAKAKAVKPVYKPSSKLRGHPREPESVKFSKTISWILRHGAQKEGIAMREDGYVKVQDLLSSPKLRSLDFFNLERIVQEDEKMRYHLLFEPKPAGEPFADDVWWIRANQGHSLKDVDLQHSEITDSGQVPMAVHGTNQKAWESIAKQGLSPMKRQHIHFAQGVPADKVISGMRKSSQVLIYIDLERAMRAGIKFYLADNGVILSKGDESGFVPIEFFSRVEDAQQRPIKGWKQTTSADLESGIINEPEAEVLTKAVEQVSLTDQTAPVTGEQATSGNVNDHDDKKVP